jgi:hypothetical protein
MRKAPAWVAIALLGAAGPAAAQAPKPDAAAERPAAPAPAPRLNLKLDNPGRYAQESPGEGGAAALPALGGDARPLPATSPTPNTAGTFPKDSQQGQR